LIRRKAASRFLGLLAAAIVIAALSSCAAPVVTAPAEVPAEKSFLRLEPIAFDKLPGWKGDDHSAALPPLLKSCEKIRAMPADRPMGAADAARGLAGRAGIWHKICADAALIRKEAGADSRDPRSVACQFSGDSHIAPDGKPVARGIARLGCRFCGECRAGAISFGQPELRLRRPLTNDCP